MPRCRVMAAIALLCAVPCARASDGALGSVRLPLPAAELAAAVGMHRVDPSTLPIDLVRLVFASPDNGNSPEAATRAALERALAKNGAGDPIPLPLSVKSWTAHILREPVPEDRLAATILSRRPTALLYHGLLAIDGVTLSWIDQHPPAIRALAMNAAVAAAYAGAIRIRDDAIVTPGENAREVWEALVGTDPRQPAAFIERLLSVRNGRLAAFYDAVGRLDAAHQSFVIGRAGDRNRVQFARTVFDAVAGQPGPWTIAARPFLRQDVDMLWFLRAVDVDARGVPRPPFSRALWAKVFGEGSGGDQPADAAWLARHVLNGAAGVSRRRVDALRFAQRAFGSGVEETPDLIFALREHERYPALMATLERFAIRDAAVYAAAARAAAAVEGDDTTLLLFQASLSLLDRARRSQTLDASAARTLAASLIEAAGNKSPRRTVAAWVANALLPALRDAVARTSDAPPDGEAVLLQALAGRPTSPAVLVRWEGMDYVADVAPAELRRLTRIRRRQGEAPIDEALAAAAAGDEQPLASSLAAVVYACALGEASGPAVNAGAIWRRHQFRGHGPGQAGPASAWRIATEIFDAAGWHLAGSLLRLDVAVAHLALRRLDATEMPPASHLSTSDRRTLASTIALIDPQQLTDAHRDAIAAALERGRARVGALASGGETVEAVAAGAGLSGWRRNTLAWTLANAPAKVSDSFTLLELMRLGGGGAPDAWGASALTLDGCLCLMMPDGVPWEDFTGRASTGQLGTQLPDVMLRTAEILSRRKLPALLGRDVAAFAMQDVMDRAQPAYFDDWLSVAFAARDLPADRFDDYVAALTVAGPLMPAAKDAGR